MIIDGKYYPGLPIRDKRIVNRMIKEGKYWEPVLIGKKTYIMTFHYTVFEKV